MPDPTNDFSEALHALIELGRQEEEHAKARIDLMKRVAVLAELAAAKQQAAEIKLTKRELAILDVIGDGSLKGEQVAKLLDVEYAGSFKETLAAMTRYGVLEQTDNGYRRKRQ